MIPQAPTTDDRLLRAIRQLIREEFPVADYRGVYEYAIQSTDGSTVEASPTDTSIGLPSLTKVPLRVNSFGVITPSVGSTCLVSFVNADPSRPFILGTTPNPSLVTVNTGLGAGEHVITTEAAINIVASLLHSLSIQIGTAGSSPLTGTSLAALIAALDADSPLATIISHAATGTVGASTLTSIHAALAIKVPDPSGATPSVGCPNFKAG
jgi:hypothetical protein